mgnify:CR=1 FL=1
MGLEVATAAEFSEGVEVKVVSADRVEVTASEELEVTGPYFFPKGEYVVGLKVVTSANFSTAEEVVEVTVVSQAEPFSTEDGVEVTGLMELGSTMILDVDFFPTDE